MAKIETIKKAVASYLDGELMPQLAGGSVQRVLAGTAISIALKRCDPWIEEIKQNEMLRKLGIIDEDGDVDVKLLRDELKAQLKKDGMTIDVPVVGKMTFHAADVDVLYKYIEEADG